MRFTFSLDASIENPAELYRAAVARARAEQAPGKLSDDEVIAMLGTESEPDFSACIVMLLDPGSIPGCDVDNSSVEEY